MRWTGHDEYSAHYVLSLLSSLLRERVPGSDFALRLFHAFHGQTHAFVAAVTPRPLSKDMAEARNLIYSMARHRWR